MQVDQGPKYRKETQVLSKDHSIKGCSGRFWLPSNQNILLTRWGHALTFGSFADPDL